MKESTQRKKTYSRLQCDNDFELESDLVEHERIHSEEKPYNCPQCDENFDPESNLLEHERIHSEEKTYSCPQSRNHFELERRDLLEDERIRYDI